MVNTMHFAISESFHFARRQKLPAQHPLVDTIDVHHRIQVRLFGHETQLLAEIRGVHVDNRNWNISIRLGAVQHQRNRVLQGKLRFEELEHADRLLKRSGVVL